MPARPDPAHRSRPPRTAQPAPGAAGAGALEAFSARWEWPLLAGMMALYVLVYLTVTASKARWYLYSDFDWAIFVQATSSILRGTTYGSIRGMHWPGDHASLVLYLVAPVYAVFRHPFTLLAIQTLALASGAVAVARLARREIGLAFPALGCAALYLLYPALGYANLYEFHPETLATTALLFTLDATRAGEWRRASLFALLSLACREDVALATLALAAYALAIRAPRARPIAATLAALSVASLALTFGVLRPAFGSAAADYSAMYSDWGATPRAVIGTVLTQPLRVVRALFVTTGSPNDTLLKLGWHFQMLLPLVFLPLAAPLTLAVALPIVLEHFLSWRQPQHVIVFQYAALVIPFYVAAAVLGLKRVSTGLRANARGTMPPRRAAAWTWAALLGAVAGNLLFGPLAPHAPLQLASSQEATGPTPEDRAMGHYRDRLLARVPAHGGVVASFEFLARLAHRDSVTSLHHVLMGSYTFSNQPFPTPEGVVAMLADLAHPRMLPYFDPGTGARLARLIDTNHLGLADAAGDVVLFLRDVPDTIGLVRLMGPDARPAATLFDGQLAFVGANLPDSNAAPRGRLVIRTDWRRVAPTSSAFVLDWIVTDELGQTVVRSTHVLGYGYEPVTAWPTDATIRESYRLVLPPNLLPGTYAVSFMVGRQEGRDRIASQPSDPAVAARGMLVPVARFTIRPGAIAAP